MRIYLSYLYRQLFAFIIFNFLIFLILLSGFNIGINSIIVILFIFILIYFKDLIKNFFLKEIQIKISDEKIELYNFDLSINKVIHFNELEHYTITFFKGRESKIYFKLFNGKKHTFVFHKTQDCIDSNFVVFSIHLAINKYCKNNIEVKKLKLPFWGSLNGKYCIISIFIISILLILYSIFLEIQISELIAPILIISGGIISLFAERTKSIELYHRLSKEDFDISTI